MLRPHPARPDARQEGGDRRVPPAQVPQRGAVAAAHRLRADQAVLRQMLHQAEEPGQFRRVHPLFIQGQDEVAARGLQRVVGVFHALGDAAIGDHGADVVAGRKVRQRLVGDLGVNRHGYGQWVQFSMRPHLKLSA